MVIDGIIFGIHGDTDGVDFESSLEIAPLLSLLDLLRRKSSPGPPWTETRSANLKTHSLATKKTIPCVRMSKTNLDFCVPVLSLTDGLHLLISMVVPLKGLPISLLLLLLLLPASGPATPLNIFSL